VSDAGSAPVNEKFAFDPMDTSKNKDWSMLEAIRHECPVVRPAPGVVYTSLYGDTNEVFRSWRQFSSVGDMRAPGVTVPTEESFLGEIDAPLHPKIRRLLLKGFTIGAANAAEEWTRENVRRRLTAIAQDAHAELMGSFAIQLPGSVAAHALGIPDELHDPIMDWCNELLHSTWPALGKTERGEGIAGAFPELTAALDRLIEERKGQTGEIASSDLLSLMVRTVDEDGWRLPDQHIRTLAVNILAGSLSASYMVGNLLYRYLTDLDGFATTLAADQSLIPAAVEESLRIEAPVAFLFRTAIDDIEIGGCPISKGEHVMMGIASANRDDEVFPDGSSFRMDRDNTKKHLAFGAGPHLCLGNHLTRMVGKVVLEEMLEIMPPGTVSLVPDFQWSCVQHPMEYGPETLEVTISAST
jgi:cytochrome P450